MTPTVIEHGQPPAEERARPRWRPSVRAAFFGVVLVVLLGYTEMAFQMDWITSGGRIGPGFFPRIVGVLGVLITAGALVQSLRPGASEDDDAVFDEDEAGEGDLGHHPGTMAAISLGTGVLLVTLTWLGAIVSSAIFMIGVLAYLNPGRWVTNVVLSVLVPVGLYLLLQTGLNAGLPSGILPGF
ncbi:hypothetical protein BH24ACT8_BH24ACT8_10940 [soil metagenome]